MTDEQDLLERAIRGAEILTEGMKRHACRTIHEGELPDVLAGYSAAMRLLASRLAKEMNDGLQDNGRNVPAATARRLGADAFGPAGTGSNAN